MTPQEELVLLIELLKMLGICILVLGFLAIGVQAATYHFHRWRRKKFDDIIDKLTTLADGDVGLVSEATHATAKNGIADLKDVVDYIVRHRKPRKVGT